MTIYKLLGKEPTEKMLRNAHKNDCPSARETFIAMWEAAPEVKQELAPCEKMVEEISLILSDKDNDLSPGAILALKWLLTWVSVPLYTYPPDAQAEIERLKAVIDKCQAALNEVTDLVSESSGVYGLHLNGDVSPWDEILAGGRFERLTSLDEAVYGIKEVKE